MRLVILESPFHNDDPVEKEKNITYARMCVRYCLLMGWSPLASHLLHTQPGILDDQTPEERRLGIRAGLEWLRGADATVVFTDRGISSGMCQGIRAALRRGVPVEYYSLVKEGWL